MQDLWQCSGHDWDQREVILFRKIHKMTHNQFHAVVSRPRLTPGTSDATTGYGGFMDPIWDLQLNDCLVSI